MSLTSRRNGTGRLYVRRFDHEEAARRYAAGERVADLAAEYGVSIGAIYRVVTPGAKARGVEAHRRWRTGACEECGGPAMRLVGGKAQHNQDGRCLCGVCRGKERRTRFVEINGELHAACHTCHEVRPLDAYSGGTRYRDVRPNGVHGTCRSCHTEIKRRYRDAHPDYNARQNRARVASRSERRAVQPEAVSPDGRAEAS